MKSPGRIQRIETVILVAALCACPVVSAAVIAAVALGFVRALGIPHDVAISAGVGVTALVANAAAFGLAFAKSDSEDRIRELTEAEAPAAEAIAS